MRNRCIKTSRIVTLMTLSLGLNVYSSLPLSASLENKESATIVNTFSQDKAKEVVVAKTSKPRSKVSKDLDKIDVEKKYSKNNTVNEQDSLQSSMQAYMDYRYNRQKQLAKWAKGRVKALKSKFNQIESRKN